MRKRWASSRKQKIRELYRQGNRQDAIKLLDNIIFNLRLADDAELIRWGSTLKRWREPILNHFDNHATNAFTEGCHTKIKMLKRISYGIRNVELYWRQMLLGFVPSHSYFHTIWRNIGVRIQPEDRRADYIKRNSMLWENSAFRRQETGVIGIG